MHKTHNPAHPLLFLIRAFPMPRFPGSRVWCSFQASTSHKLRAGHMDPPCPSPVCPQKRWSICANCNDNRGQTTGFAVNPSVRNFYLKSERHAMTYCASVCNSVQRAVQQSYSHTCNMHMYMPHFYPRCHDKSASHAQVECNPPASKR